VNGCDSVTDDRHEERRRVAEADDRLRRALERREVEIRNDALAAVATPRAEDGAHARVVEHALQVGAPDVILAGEIGPARTDAIAEHHA
jgi:hypothetical protein